jgi:hypothetical protein
MISFSKSIFPYSILIAFPEICENKSFIFVKAVKMHRLDFISFKIFSNNKIKKTNLSFGSTSTFRFLVYQLKIISDQNRVLKYSSLNRQKRRERFHFISYQRNSIMSNLFRERERKKGRAAAKIAVTRVPAPTQWPFFLFSRI